MKYSPEKESASKQLNTGFKRLQLTCWLVFLILFGPYFLVVGLAIYHSGYCGLNCSAHPILNALSQNISELLVLGLYGVMIYILLMVAALVTWVSCWGIRQSNKDDKIQDDKTQEDKTQEELESLLPNTEYRV